MRNEHSSSGIAEDIIRAITQLTATEMHLKTLYEKTRAELENGIIDTENPDEVRNALDKAEAYREDMIRTTELRRRTMLKLYNMFEGDKDVWCLIKHLAGASETLHEAYMASDDDAELLELALDANKEFTKAITRFLGVEITDCAACLTDMLKGE